MPPGKTVRRLLGRFEPVAIRVYRNAFVDLDAAAVNISSVAPSSRRVLEIGCGDGAMAASIRRTLPDSRILGIDPGSVSPGGMYDGDRDGVEFRPITTTELIAEGPPPFDLIVICDVLHHVADDERVQVVRDAATLSAPGATIAIKEWERRPGLSYFPAFAADRFVSGDATVRFMGRPELLDIIETALPGWVVTCESRIPPRQANILLTLQRPQQV